MLLSPTAQVLFDEYGRWIERARYRNDADVRPLQKAAAKHLQLGRKLPLPEVAPTLACVYFSLVEFEGSLWKRWLTVLGCWFLRVRVLRGRPMWNDFWMCLWQLSRDPRYIGRLHSHLKRATPVQLETGHWMVTSVCQQDLEFAEHWQDIVKERGEVFVWGT